MATAIPSVNFTILTNGLGNSALSPSNIVSVFGCSSSGTSNVPTIYRSTAGKVVTDYGYGPGPELVANLVRSGITCVFTKVDTDVVGSVGAVTHTGTGTSAMTVTGTPFDAYEIVVLGTRAGTAGSDPEPGFKVSFDGGRTYSREIRMPASLSYDGFVGTTGLTLVFTVGTIVVDDTYEADSTGPTWVAADVTAALEAFRLIKQDAALRYVVGAASKSDGDLIAASNDTFLERKKFGRIFVEAADIGSGQTEDAWMTALEGAWASFQNDRVLVGAGAARVQSCLSGILYRRNMGWLAIVRAGLVRPGRDVGAIEDGSLVPFSPNGQGQPVSEVYHDEGLNPGLNANRFMTLMSVPGLDGYFVCNANIMSDETSDFDLLQLGRVMDEACRVTNLFFGKKLSTSVRLDRRTGFILEKDARALESGNDAVLAAALVATGDMSQRDQYTVVSREDNIATTKTLTVTVGLLPLGYLKTINVTMTYVNPALGLAA